MPHGYDGEKNGTMHSRKTIELLELLKAIDADHPKDFIDSVCAARDALPDTTEEELAAVAHGCAINPFSSRCCEKGTKSCEVRHNV